uniref:Venom hydrolase-like protein n=1 Tax=Lethocerus distinctifemur TaxID=280095 RepID=A0A2K8JLG6_9HEMI|nr:venom hydrolase-like protein [Lethocerus distinctifemur]
MLATIIVLALAATAQAMTVGKGDRRTKVIMDVDAGADDAMAIMIAVSSVKKIDVIAITCVNGNTGVHNVTKNVLKTLKVANRLDIPVHAGSEDALVYRAPSDSFWGSDGLGDFEFKEPPSLSMIEDKHAALAIVELVKKYPNEITILAVGPLTNIALAMHLYPQLLDEVKELVILAGSYLGGGNVKPGVEFNVYADPEAADFVFSKAKVDHPIRALPLETIEKLGFSMDFRINQLGKLPGPKMEFLNKAENKGLKNFERETQWSAYDQLAAAVVINPKIVLKSVKLNVRVETCGRYARGAWIVDHRSFSPPGPVEIITEVDREAVRQLFLDTLK